MCVNTWSDHRDPARRAVHTAARERRQARQVRVGQADGLGQEARRRLALARRQIRAPQQAPQPVRLGGLERAIGPRDRRPHADHQQDLRLRVSGVRHTGHCTRRPR